MTFLQQVGPSQLSKSAAKIYQSAGPFWRLMQSLRPHICPFEAIIAHVPPKGRVLDVGCGAGISLLLLADLHAIESGFGFDASPHAIGAARAGCQTMPRGTVLEFCVRSVDQGIPAGDWSAVLVIDVVHHLPSREQKDFLLAAAAAVPPGGRLIIKEMSPGSGWRSAANVLHDLVMARQVIHQVSSQRVDGWLSSSGLHKTHGSTHTRLWYAHWLSVWERAH